MTNMSQPERFHDDQKSSQDTTQYNAYTHMGEYLKAVRLQKSLSQKDIQEALKIKVRIITAIEAQDHNILPDKVTTSALVRQYASYLGLDAQEVGLEYKQEIQGADHKIDVVFPDKLPTSFKPVKKVLFISFMTIGVFFIWKTINNVNNILPDIKPISDFTSAMTSDANAIMHMGKSSSMSQATLQIIPEINFEIIRQPDVILHARGGDSWIEIKNSKTQQIIHSAILKSGQKYKIPSDIENLRLKAGNSAPLVIEVNGQILGLMPKNSRVLRDFNIDTRYLIDYYNKHHI